MADYSLFPKNEEWGSGDEALDNKLSSASKKVKENLSFDSISEFYFYGLTLQPRAYNPAFHSTIELVTKAFFFLLSPDECIDQQMQKLKGHYYSKERVPFILENIEAFIDELKTKKMVRFKGQIDFYLHHQDNQERNPFVRESLKRSPVDLHAKIMMKDFKAYLSGEKDLKIDEPLFLSLRSGNQVLMIGQFAEIWYHQGSIYMIPLL